MLQLRLERDSIGMFEFGNPLAFKIYNEDGTPYDATTLSLSEVIVKILKRPGDKALFFRDVSKAISIVRGVAQIVEDISGSWTTQASGEATFTFTETKRVGIGGKAWVKVVLKNAGGTIRIPTELRPLFVEQGIE